MASTLPRESRDRLPAWELLYRRAINTPKLALLREPSERLAGTIGRLARAGPHREDIHAAWTALRATKTVAQGLEIDETMRAEVLRDCLTVKREIDRLLIEDSARGGPSAVEPFSALTFFFEQGYPSDRGLVECIVADSPQTERLKQRVRNRLEKRARMETLRQSLQRILLIGYGVGTTMIVGGALAWFGKFSDGSAGFMAKFAGCAALGLGIEVVLLVALIQMATSRRDSAWSE